MVVGCVHRTSENSRAIHLTAASHPIPELRGRRVGGTIPDGVSTDNPEEYVTEVQIPVAPV